MTIAKHLSKRDSMSYDARDFPHDRWKSRLAYHILRRVPKFKEDFEVTVRRAEDNCDEMDASFESQEVTEDPADVPTPMESNEMPEATADLPFDNPSSSDVPGEDEDAASSSSRRSSRGGHSGHKQAKEAFQNSKFKERSLRNAQVMAEAMRRRV